VGIQTARKEEKKMSQGFDKLEFDLPVNIDEVKKLLKKYKKLKKYAKSNIFQIKTIDKTETVISSLIKEAEENPIE
jgi:hypothetical protein